VLPLAFGEAGLPVHPLLREALAAAAGRNAYAPVAGLPELREAAAGLLDPARPAHQRRRGRVRTGQQAATVRPAARRRCRRRGAQAELG